MLDLVRDEGVSDKVRNERKKMQKKLAAEFKTWLNDFEKTVKEAKIKEEKAVETSRGISTAASHSTADEEEGVRNKNHTIMISTNFLI